MRFHGLAVAAIVAWLPSVALADTLAEREAALADAWKEAPLTVRNAAFISGEPGGFGVYEKRPSNVFSPGEKIIVYAEPVAYGFRGTEDGRKEFGFTVDLAIKTPDGTIKGRQEGFGRMVLKSHAENREFMIKLDVDLSGAPAGDYALAFTLHDVTGPKTATFELPFKIAE